MVDFFGPNNSWISYEYNGGIINVDMREVVRFSSSPSQHYYVLRGISELFPCDFETYEIIREFKESKI